MFWQPSGWRGMFINVGDSYDSGEEKHMGYCTQWHERHVTSAGLREGPLLQENISQCF